MLVATGVVKSKRQNTSSQVAIYNGVFLRFKDGADRERYIEVIEFRSNVELKSKDIFSLTVSENPAVGHVDGKTTKEAVMKLTLKNSPVVEENEKRKNGLVSIMNLTLNTSPVISLISQRDNLLAAIQGNVD